MMPKKQNAESQKDQSERFKREAQNLIDVGELSPTEADKQMDRMLRQKATKPS